ncbi:MAG: molybdenum cofactor biosynthesis protein MoaE [Candidatus Dadabacteria bacterium]|nr:molybdenum cofactor biosynthesis protein MoaE [Candidatus Dadabacteria bacterium]
MPGTFSEDAGATVIFTGTVRRYSRGRVVQHLFYDVYEEMALSEFASIGREIRERWNIEKLTIVHRTGSVEVGEISDFIAVSSEHSDEAYKAPRYIIEELKSSVPIWKKEVWSGGEEWVQGS